MEHPEVASPMMLNKLVAKYGIQSGSDYNPGSKDAIDVRPPQWEIVLIDAMNRMNRSNLTNWAFAIERYHFNGSQVFGGLHDNLLQMSDEDIRKFILREAREHPEVARAERLNALVARYKIQIQLAAVPSNPPGSDGGLHDALATMKRKELVEVAFTLERYHFKGEAVFGGLHDNVWNLSNEEVKDFIKKELNEHPEVANLKRIKELTALYSQGQNIRLSLADNDKILENIKSFDRKHIKAYAIAMDHYDLERNPERVGGIDDYIGQIHTAEIIEYIERFIGTYPELNSKSKIEGELMKKYGIEFKDD